MNSSRLITSMTLLLAMPASLDSQQDFKLGQNAALRYWSAFAEMQDSAITDQHAKELSVILDGTAPYDDLKYKNLVEKNRPAVDTMARARVLPNCHSGVDYELA